jgi:hypothetical protein
MEVAIENSYPMGMTNSGRMLSALERFRLNAIVYFGSI